MKRLRLSEEERKRRGAEAARQWRRDNYERVLESNRRSHAKHREERAARARAWRQKNLEIVRAYDRRRYAENREARNAHCRAWNAANRERVYWNDLRKKYGISRDQFEAMFETQGRRCAICRSDRPGTPSGRFFIDHDHATGRVRAILCGHCNSAVGYVREDPAIALAVAEYLFKHKPASEAA